MSVGSRKQWESQVETIYMIRPTHLNSAGRLFGGILMQWIDEAAGLVAIRHSRRNVTTASVDEKGAVMDSVDAAFKRGISGRYSYYQRKAYLCRKNFYGS